MIVKQALLNLGRVVVFVAIGALSTGSASGQGFRVLKTFDNLGCPSSDTVRDSKGHLYATVACGGDMNQGAVIRLAPDGKLTILHSFAGGSGGENPQGELLRGGDGTLYGTTLLGGFGAGTIYKVARDGTFTLLHSFTYGVDGGFSRGGLIRDSSDNLYGTAISGGPGGSGTVFRVASDGAFTVLHSFSFEDGTGYGPSCCLVRDGDGNLYGTTSSGGTGPGAFGYGVIYKLAPDGTYTVLHSFTGGEDGAQPFGLVRFGGAFYGLTSSGGVSLQGTAFKLTAKGTFSVLHSFSGSDSPTSGLVSDGNGNFYGTSPQGGSRNQGTIFRLSSDGALTVVHEFTGEDDGGAPRSRPVLDDVGNVYGMVIFGNAGTHGKIFRVAADGAYTTLSELRLSSLAADVALDSSGNILGTTLNGGVGFGSVFAFAPVDRSYTERYSFTGVEDGNLPIGGPLLDATGAIYGTASYGGNFNAGTIFKLAADGDFTVLHAFGDYSVLPPDGAVPLAGLSTDGSGNLYGTAQGGTVGGGIVFKVSASGSYTVLHDFGFGDGQVPTAAVTVDGDGNLYGTTSQGGDAGLGTAYKLGSDGSYSILHSFVGPEGATPLGTLTVDSSGNLYGTTSAGGSANLGNVFKLATDGTLTSLHDFAQADGSSPMGGVVRDSRGSLYGTTSRGGASDLGTVFRLAADGTYTILHSFIGNDGAIPKGSLKLYGNILYGTTSTGGPLAGGSLFQIRP
jgi:uncharacterized repeat protein (TIGR03803 family)